MEGIVRGGNNEGVKINGTYKQTCLLDTTSGIVNNGDLIKISQRGLSLLGTYSNTTSENSMTYFEAKFINETCFVDVKPNGYNIEVKVYNIENNNPILKTTTVIFSDSTNISDFSFTKAYDNMFVVSYYSSFKTCLLGFKVNADFTVTTGAQLTLANNFDRPYLIPVYNSKYCIFSYEYSNTIYNMLVSINTNLSISKHNEVTITLSSYPKCGHVNLGNGIIGIFVTRPSTSDFMYTLKVTGSTLSIVYGYASGLPSFDVTYRRYTQISDVDETNSVFVHCLGLYSEGGSYRPAYQAVTKITLNGDNSITFINKGPYGVNNGVDHFESSYNDFWVVKTAEKQATIFFAGLPYNNATERNKLKSYDAIAVFDGTNLSLTSTHLTPRTVSTYPAMSHSYTGLYNSMAVNGKFLALINTGKTTILKKTISVKKKQIYTEATESADGMALGTANPNTESNFLLWNK